MYCRAGDATRILECRLNASADAIFRPELVRVSIAVIITQYAVIIVGFAVWGIIWAMTLRRRPYANSPEIDHSFSSETDHLFRRVISELGAKRRWLFDCDRD